MKPSTAEYQKHRKDTLRGIEKTKVFEVARQLARENQKRGRHYTRAVLRALRPQ